VPFHVPSPYHVVEPVAEEFAEDGGHDGGEVEEANLTQSKIIQRSHEYAKRGINTHHPGKSKAIIKHAQKNHRFGNHKPRSHKMPAMAYSSASCYAIVQCLTISSNGLWDGTLRRRNMAVVEGFVDEEGYEDEAETGEHG